MSGVGLPRYSALSTVTGSTDVARRAGPRQASAETPITKRGFHFIGLVFVGSAIVERAPTLTSQEN